MKRSRLNQIPTLPPPDPFGPGAILVHDEALAEHVAGFEAWAAAFPARLAVSAGEGLKDVAAFPQHIARLTELTRGFSRDQITLVCTGGGSIGDFGGFCASLLKRGVGLVHVPSTWLAAVDSAHGGKTALNVGGAKNQIGTFHAADTVYLVRELLFAQPDERAFEGMAELVKMAFLDSDAWVEEFFASKKRGAELFWDFLKPAIEAKWRVVSADPEERLGVRQILNLGHTVGHVLEAHHGLSHGAAVTQGLHCALGWSREKVGLTPVDHDILASILADRTQAPPATETLPAMQRDRFVALLGQDKKAAGAGKVNFVFLKGQGKPVRREVRLDEVAEEATRQGWVQ